MFDILPCVRFTMNSSLYYYFYLLLAFTLCLVRGIFEGKEREGKEIEMKGLDFPCLDMRKKGKERLNSAKEEVGPTKTVKKFPPNWAKNQWRKRVLLILQSCPLLPSLFHSDPLTSSDLPLFLSKVGEVVRKPQWWRRRRNIGQMSSGRVNSGGGSGFPPLQTRRFLWGRSESAI